MATPRQYCLRWRHHHSNVQNMFAQLLEEERFCDVTLYCSPSFATQVPDKDTVDPQTIRGVSLRAHRVVLAACSELLGALLGAHEAHGEPVLVIDGAEPKHMRALLDYMYTGEMNVHHSQLAGLLKTAEELRIKGLTDIRWNNKDEPPDCKQGNLGITTTPATVTQTVTPQPSPESKTDRANDRAKLSDKAKQSERSEKCDNPELRNYLNLKIDEGDAKQEKFNVNGGPPPLIKLPTKTSPLKRDNSESESPSPKRQRMTSVTGTHDSDDDESRDKDQEWQHGNLDITAERVVNWGAGSEDWSRDGSDDEWADAPTDIGSFLHTRLRVDGDNSADEESNGSLPATSVPTSSGVSPADIKVDMLHAPFITLQNVGPKSSGTDPRFSDVVKLNDYLQHGRRPQFWEENYVKRVMEAVRLKELEMKQAAEILGVSYGTLYGRYRDVYGCINRPYRDTRGNSGTESFYNARDFWHAKGPSEVLERLQRGEMAIDAASAALGVSPANLAAYVADPEHEKKFEPIPIEIDPSLKMKSRPYLSQGKSSKYKGNAQDGKTPPRKVMVGSLEDEESIPASVITPMEVTSPTNTPTSGKWPSIRVASLDTLREPTDPSHLMRTRPDLTIVAAKKQTDRDGDTT